MTTPTNAAPAKAPNSVHVTLIYAIKIAGAEVNRLTMRRPKARDRLIAEDQAKGQSDLQADLQLIANLCEVDVKELEELDLVDLSAVQAELSKMIKFPR